MKNLFASFAVLLFPAVYCLAIVEIKEDTHIDNSALTDSYVVSGNSTLTVDQTSGNFELGSFNIKVESGSTLALNNLDAMEFKTGSSSRDTANIFDIYGKIEKTGSGTLHFIISDQANQYTVFNFYSGSELKSSGGSIEIRRGKAQFNIMKGATISGVNDLHVGGRGNDSSSPDAVFNVQGSATFGAWVRLGNTALGDGFSGRAVLNITDGGYLKTRDLVTNQGTGYEASILLKGLGSTLEVTNGGGTKNVVLNSVNDARSSSTLSIYTGATMKVAGNDGLVSNSGSRVIFGLDSNISEALGTAMLSISKLTVNTADSQKTFSIDASSLGYVSGLEKGDVVDVILFDMLSSITFNGMEYLISAMSDAQLQELLSQFMDFDFAGNSYWEAADISDIHKVGNQIGFSMTYIPEPGAYAAAFGFIALAFGLCRRRR